MMMMVVEDGGRGGRNSIFAGDGCGSGRNDISVNKMKPNVTNANLSFCKRISFLIWVRCE